MENKTKMLQAKLEHQLRNTVRETSREPNLIVMHPLTWTYLIHEVTLHMRLGVYMQDSNLMYRGIKVRRSLDMNEGEFEM